MGAHVFRHKLGPLLVQKSGTRIWDLLCFIRQGVFEQVLAAFWWSPVVSSALRRKTQRNTWCLRQAKAQPLRVMESFAVKAMYNLLRKAAVNKNNEVFTVVRFATAKVALHGLWIARGSEAM